MYWLLHKNIKLRIVNKYETNQTAYSLDCCYTLK